MQSTLARLYPLLRSITGNGVRETLRILKEDLCPDLEVIEVPTGTQAYDWQVPLEWNCRKATLTGPDGIVYADMALHNLHVLNYSRPMQGQFKLDELDNGHLFSLPVQPELIPYRTSYYANNWGFCLAHRIRETMPRQGLYSVNIDAELTEGSLTYGQIVIPGQTTDEVLISTHVCHPSLADDNLSGMVVAAQLATWLGMQPRRYTYRIVLVPGTIGAITMLAQNPDLHTRVRFGLVLALLGDDMPFTYKRSRNGQTTTDFVVEQTLSQLGKPFEAIDFYPYGYDERQYNAPGQHMPVGRLSRARHGEFAEYHTSADNLQFISEANLEESLDVLKAIMEGFERQCFYQNLQPHAEPQLGRRGLYRAISGDQQSKLTEMTMLWLLNLADGQHSLDQIAAKAGTSVEEAERVARLLEECGLLVVNE